MRRFILAAYALIAVYGPLVAAFPLSAPVTLAVDRQPKMAVVTGQGANPDTVTAARELADMLSAICGNAFTVTTGDGLTGLAVGTPADFPALAPAPEFHADDPFRREEYLLRSHAGGVLLLGASPAGVRDAVWDFLYRLGYRRFFATRTWEVIPSSPTLTSLVDSVEKPDFAGRSFGISTWPENRPANEEWVVRNRMRGAFTLNTGHAYDNIIRQNKAAFDAHPEFYGLLNGERKSTKLCIANPALRQLVIDHALKSLRANTALDSVSVDPSDGGGWCECAECARLGSISDRALTLANAVAEAIAREIGPRRVGMYAYHQHSPPPTINVHPNVIISIATAFITGGYSVDALIDGWHARGARLGIREYFSVNTWDRDRPGAARAANSAYLTDAFSRYHAGGAVAIITDPGDNWGPCGLGYYLASRMAWDVKDAARLPELTDDFLTRCFGPAREPMRRFYALIDGKNAPLMSADLIGRMYREIDAALKVAPDVAVRDRLYDLLLYTRYVELLNAYEESNGAARQANFETLIRFAYRIRRTGMVQSYWLYRDLVTRDKSVVIPAEAQFTVPEGKNPWKSSEPYTADDYARMLTDGIAANPLLAFTPVQFSRQLMRPDALRLTDLFDEGRTDWGTRATNRIYTWVDRAPVTLELMVTGGLIYRNRGDVQLRLYPADEPEGKAVATAAVPPDAQPHRVTLLTPYAGLHAIEVSDGSDASRLEWPRGMPLTWDTNATGWRVAGEERLVFYVPKGTTVIGGFYSGRGVMLDPDGKVAHAWQGRREYFAVPVPAGQDGRLWGLRANLGSQTLRLMTVPPFLARNSQALLLPREVVEADKAR